MFLFKLLALPITAPTNGLMSVFRTIQREVNDQHNNPDVLKAQLANIQKLLDNGEITEEEYLVLEEDILDRLEAIYDMQE